MSTYLEAENTLKTLLGKLGFEISVEIIESEDSPIFNIISDESDSIIGKNGDRLEDIQYLLNRIVSVKDESAPRIKVDCDGFRKNQEKELLETVKQLAEQVKETGIPEKTKPLNSYYRRIVHNAFVDDAEIETSSPGNDSRFKRIVISKVS